MADGDAPFTEDELLLRDRRTDPRRLPRLLLFSLRLVRRSAGRSLSVVAVLQIVAAVGLAGQLLLTQSLLTVVLERPGVELADALPRVVLLTAVTLVVSAANLARTEQQRVLALMVERHAIDLVVGISNDVELIAFDDPSFHNRLQRAQANAALRPVDMVTGLIGVFGSLVMTGGIMVALVTIEPLFILVLAVGWIPVWLAGRYASRLTYSFTARQTERDRRRAYLYGVLSSREHAAELRAFGLAAPFRRRHAALFDERLEDLRSTGAKRLRAGLASVVFNSLISGAALVLLVWFLATGRLTPAEAGTTAGALVLLRGRLQGFAGSASALYENALYLEDVTAFVKEGQRRVAPPPTLAAPEGWDVIAAHDISFAYPGARQPALRHVSIRVGRGEVVALVGENGSGKSTLAKVLAGLYQPMAGAVTWDGVDIREYDPETVRASVAIAFQDYAKYFLSARDNITAGRPERPPTDEAVTDAARRASAHELIEGLPHRYDTLLGPEYFGGTDLSLGQWQRIALARAFFRDAPLIILDEPTAALDPRAEYELFQSVRSLLARRSVVLISHRFSSVRSADRIYVLKEGSVVESGSHEDLLRAGGLYEELFSLQADAYGREQQVREGSG